MFQIQSPGCGKTRLDVCYRSTSLLNSDTSSLWRDTPVLENTRLSTERAISSVIPSLSDASRGARPEPISAATRASPNVSPNMSRTKAGSAGPLRGIYVTETSGTFS